MKINSARWTAALGAALLVTLLSLPAVAGHFAFGAGSGIEMVRSTTQVKLQQEAGFHFSRWRSGPGLGIALSEAFGDDVVVFTAAPKFFWELTIVRSRGVALSGTPSMHLGYGLRAPRGGDPNHFMNLKVAFSFKLRFGRFFFSFDPFGLDLYFGDQVWMRYDLAGGIGISF